MSVCLVTKDHVQITPWEVLWRTLGASVMLLSSSVDTWNSQDRLSTDTYNVVNSTETLTEVTT